MVKGCAQQHGIDYTETYAPVLKHSSPRIIFALSVNYGLTIYVSQATRPDIAHATSVLSKYNQTPRRIHWGAMKRVFRYRKGTQSKRLEFRKGGQAAIEGFSDADWAGESDNRRSVTSFLFLMQDAAVS